MEKSLIHFVISFPTGHKTSIVSKPSIGPFNLPSSFVAPQGSTVLKFCFLIPSRWSYEFNTAFFKFLSEGIRVISLVANQTFGFFAQLLDTFVNQCHLMWTGRGNRHSQRKTLAVCHHHELRALAPLGFPDFWAPFFADTNVPSMKHSLQSIWPFLSSLRMKVRHIFSQTPCSSQSFKRLQQVLGLGYFSGRSFHRAPVRRTQRIPSNTKRLFFQGLPLLFNFGTSGSIDFHCLSVKYIARLIGCCPPMNLYRQIT